MAKSRSLLRLVGQIGGMVFYNRDGETVVREHNPITKARIMSEDAFVRTRENMQEFGGSIIVAKVLTQGLRFLLRRMGSRNSYSGLVKLFRELISNGSGTRGQLSLDIVPNRNRLLGHGFSGTTTFGSAYGETYTLTANPARNSATLTLPAFNPPDALHFPQGATHFRVALGIISISDHLYNAVMKRYEPTQVALNGIKELVWSADTAIGSGVVTVPALTATLPGSPSLTPDSGLITVIGIEFLQEVSGNNYLLAEGNAMVIAEVF